jgi:phosphoglycolate phosphatase
MTTALALTGPKALLFDWDNTLVDTWSVIHRALNETFAAMGTPLWTMEETKARVRGSARDSFPLLFGERWEEAQTWFYDAFRASHLQELRPLPGAEAMLRRLANRGLYLAVLSNKQGKILRAEAEHLGWTDLFGSIVGATDAARDKPAADAVQLALLGSGHRPGPSVWLVGDTDIDMECALASGLTPVLLRPHAPGAGEFDACPPSCHIAHCQALVQLVEGHERS